MLERNSNGMQTIFLSDGVSMFTQLDINLIICSLDGQKTHSYLVSLVDNVEEEVDVNKLLELLNQKQDRISAVPTCLSSVIHVPY